MEVLFHAVEGEAHTYTRRPITGLRLITKGEPPSKLIALPAWDSRGKTIDCSIIRCELMAEKSAVVGAHHVQKWDVLFACRINSRGLHCNQFRYRTGLGDLDRVVSTIRDYQQDRRAVLARSYDHCSICQRKLTDGLSRSRGIGPECIRYFHFVEGTIMIPEPVGG
jgi:hypothetical protein